MRGLIVAGGLGTRLGALTQSNNKHLLPVYDKPMIFYPMQTLISAGIKEIAIVVSGPFAGNFLKILNNGSDFNLKSLSFFYQSTPDGGIADAIKCASSFIKGHNVAVILGDNTTDADISKDVSTFEGSNIGAKIFLKEVSNPNEFGCPKFDSNKIVEIIEKPQIAPSNYAVTGVYLFDELLNYYAQKLKPSARNQLEITDILNFYIKEDRLEWADLNGFWKDAGTYDNLLEASIYWKNKKNS
jgi:glucose-1-phosphate thymidylyltransferase